MNDFVSHLVLYQLPEFFFNPVCSITKIETVLALAWSLWRNRLARSAVNRKVGGSSPPRDDQLL